MRLGVALGVQVGWATSSEVAAGIAVFTVLAALLTFPGGLVVRRGRLR